MIEKLALFDAFARTLWRRRFIRTHEQLDAFQQACLRRVIDHAARTTRAYSGLSGAALADLPVTEKSGVLADFAAYNMLGLEADEIATMIDAGQTRPGFELGRSTGTSGTRGYYVISEAERYRWLGTILAKVLPDALSRRHRVAIVLPGPSPLYQSANQSRLLTLVHFDARRGIPALLDSIADFGPTVVLAAPKSLRLLAIDKRLRPARVISAAEVADPMDLAFIDAAFGDTSGQVYMATEGLFGTSCSAGRLHLAEDVAFFEFRPVTADPTLVTAL